MRKQDGKPRAKTLSAGYEGGESGMLESLALEMGLEMGSGASIDHAAWAWPIFVFSVRGLWEACGSGLEESSMDVDTRGAGALDAKM